MNIVKASVILALLFALTSNDASSQIPSSNTRSIHLASLEVRTNQSGGLWAYLLENKFLNLRRRIVDSTLVDSGGVIRFRFAPNPNYWYSVEVGEMPVAYGSFALGDSIVIQRNPGAFILQVLYDRIGAFTVANDYYYYYGGKATTLDPLKDTSCQGISKYLDSARAISQHLHALAVSVHTKFPERTYFVRDLRRWSQLFETFAMAALANQVERGALPTCKSYPGRWLDTVTLNFRGEQLNPIDLAFITSFILEARYNRLKRLDSIVSRHYGLEARFQIAMQFNGFARDLAFIRLAETASSVPPEELLQFYERMLDTIRVRRGSADVRKILENRMSILLHRKAGSSAYNLMLPDSNYKLKTLRDYRGKAVLVHFWGTWCGPCLNELSRSEEFERQHSGDTDLVFLNVSLEDHNYVKWKKFCSTHDLAGINLYAEGLWQSEAAQNYGITVVPSRVLIDRQGRIVNSYMGSSWKDEDVEYGIKIAEHH